MGRSAQDSRRVMADPARRARTRPLELLLLAGALAVFTGLVVLMSTRDLVISLIFLGVAFIVSLVALAMIALAVSPPESGEPDERDRER